MKNNIKVITVTPFYPSEVHPYSGIFVESQIINLSKNGIKANIYYCVPRVPLPLSFIKLKWKELGKFEKCYERNGICINVLRYIAFPKNIGMAVSAADIYIQLKKILIKENPDLIHAHFAIPTGFAACKAAEVTNTPVVTTIHGSDINYYPYIYRGAYREKIRYTLRKSNIVLSVSHHLMRAALLIEPSANIVVNRIGVNLNEFKPFSEKREAVNKQIKILYVGNLIRPKGVYELLDAFNAVCKRLSGVQLKLIFVGDGTERRELFNKSAAFGISDRVAFLGAQDHNRISMIINEADILVLPSYREGLGQAVLEGAACGKPIIASNVGGIPEIIQDGVNGILVSPGSVNELISAIENLSVNLQLREIMGKMSRRIVEKDFNIEITTKELIEIYTKFLNR